ncbi:TPRXL [Fagus crenata]
MEDLPIEKIAISGPTLASLIQRFSSSPGPIDGLLFGHVSLLTPSTLSDDSSTPSTSTSTSFLPSSSSSSLTLIATITSFLSLSFSSPSGLVNPLVLPPPPSSHLSLLGWFSARRRSPLRPSLREFSASHSLSSLPDLSFPILNFPSSPPSLSSPCIFLLLSSPIHDQSIHTHEYRAYQFRSSSVSFDPKSIDVVNIGPAFRSHYGAFSPNAPFPLLPCELRNSMIEDEKEEKEKEEERLSVTKDQTQLDACAEGFEVGRLSKLMGNEAANYSAGLEDLYEKMLAKIETLARQVEQSSAMVFEQENHNRKLRYKVARFAGSE